MATVTGYTAARMKQIEDKAIIDGDVVGNDLILTPNGFATDPATYPKINAGNVRGPQGIQGVPGEVTDAELNAAVATINARIDAEHASGSIDGAQLADDAVTNAKMAPNSVTSIEIVDGQVGTAELANDSVTAEKIASNAVGESEIAPNAVGTSELANDAVTDAKMANATQSHSFGGGSDFNENRYGSLVFINGWLNRANTYTLQAANRPARLLRVIGVSSNSITSGFSISTAGVISYDGGAGPDNSPYYINVAFSTV